MRPRRRAPARDTGQAPVIPTLAGVTLAAAMLAAVGSGAVLAHGEDTAPPLTVWSLASAWSPDPVPWLGAILAGAVYVWAIRRVNRLHPRTPFPRWRAAAWLAGLVVILVALVSSIDRYAGSLLTAHMLQHFLLALVAPPLLALGAPILLALRAAPQDVRHRLLLPVLHARVTRAITFPPVAWLAFGAVMWATHFTAWYDAALESQALHDLEHLAFLASGVVFWWPVVGADPSPIRLTHGARLVYLVLQMPVHAAVGLAIYFAPAVLYPHYASLQRAWGPDALTDQQIGGIFMWGASDVWLLLAVAGVVAAWMQADARRARRADAAYRA